MFEYNFHIIDNEYGGEYDYKAYFFDHEEAIKFCLENKQVGNIVIILSAQVFEDERTPIENVPSNHF